LDLHAPVFVEALGERDSWSAVDVLGHVAVEPPVHSSPHRGHEALEQRELLLVLRKLREHDDGRGVEKSSRVWGHAAADDERAASAFAPAVGVESGDEQALLDRLKMDFDESLQVLRAALV